MREKLIDLISRGVPRNEPFLSKICEGLADYLIANGVTFATDTNVGDKVEVVRCKDCKSWEQYNACDGTKPHRCMNQDAIRGKDSPMHKIFGNIIYWQVWELIRKLTCIICGCQYVRHLAGCSYAEEVAEKLCQCVYDLKIEYAGKSFRNAGDKKTSTAEIDFDYEAED